MLNKISLVEPSGIEPERSDVNPNHERPTLAPHFKGNRLSSQLNSPFILVAYHLHDKNIINLLYSVNKKMLAI